MSSDNIRKKRDGTALAPLLKRKGLNCSDIARVTGMHVNTIKRIYKGDRPLEYVTYEQLKPIAECLGIKTVDDMIIQAREAVTIDRSEKMDKLLRTMVLHEANGGRISYTDMREISIEAKRKSIYERGSFEHRKEVFSNVMENLKPDKILLDFGVTEIHGPDGSLLYEIQS